ncbi:MAG: hypothetical protein KGI00_03885 [Candidatus Micrarchaeota archaeon]|nr:hypothetical protein [Candidatus Micrarchaeota archaeon]MDE1824012.1 hypothetical protein [Candidatus Micrarchaeota archaeon]MDE1849840.1 hypothetical protein [Candidatus Micrarchaeota archaeon]
MSNVLNASSSDASRKASNQRLDESILKSVIRNNWQSKMDSTERHANKKIMEEIEQHASNMYGILNGYDYEALCIPSIMANAKHMSKDDFRAYLKLMESMAIGYSNLLDKELANLLMIGLTAKTRNLGSAQRYFELLSKDLEKRVGIYNRIIERHGRKSDAIMARLKTTERHIFRIFMRKRISVMKRTLSKSMAKGQRLNSRKEKYTKLINEVKQKASPQLPQPQTSSTGL